MSRLGEKGWWRLACRATVTTESFLARSSQFDHSAKPYIDLALFSWINVYTVVRNKWAKMFLSYLLQIPADSGKIRQVVSWINLLHSFNVFHISWVASLLIVYESELRDLTQRLVPEAQRQRCWQSSSDRCQTTPTPKGMHLCLRDSTLNRRVRLKLKAYFTGLIFLWLYYIPFFQIHSVQSKTDKGVNNLNIVTTYKYIRRTTLCLALLAFQFWEVDC